MSLKGKDAMQEAEAMFEFENADLLLSYDRDTLRPALEGWMRLEGRKRVNLATDEFEDFLVVLEQGVVDLITRGALTPCRPFSSMGQQQLDSLLKKYKVTPASERPVVIPTEPCEEVVQAFKNMSGADFGKWIREDTSNERAKLFEEASVRNLI